MGSPVVTITPDQAPRSPVTITPDAAPNAGLAPPAGPSRQMDSGEGPIAQGVTSFRAQASKIPGNLKDLVLAKHWPIIDSQNWDELGQDIKSLNPVATTDPGTPNEHIDWGATAANLLPMVVDLRGGGIAESPAGRLVSAVKDSRLAGAGVAGAKAAGKAAIEHTPILGPAVKQGLKAAVKAYGESGPQPVYPGAPFPEAPPPAAALARGARPYSDPAAGLEQIPVAPNQAPEPEIIPPSRTNVTGRPNYPRGQNIDLSPGMQTPGGAVVAPRTLGLLAPGPEIADPIGQRLLDQIRQYAAQIEAQGHGEEFPEEQESTPASLDLNDDLTPALKASLRAVRAAKRNVRPKTPSVQ
jgi:hypothetical protein